MIGGPLMIRSFQAVPTGPGEPDHNSLSVGYFLLPRQLCKDCQHRGSNTLKLVLLIADITLGWDFSRWAPLTYRAIVAEAGIPNDAGVCRALMEALAASLIEVQTTPAGTLYAIHRRYWVLAKIQPRWHFFKQVPYNAEDDPFDDSLPAIARIAQPLETVAARPASTIAKIAQPLPEGAPGLAPRDAKENKKEEKEIVKESSSDDSLAQRLTDHQILQNLLAERQLLQALLPGQSGWGGAQRRLRAITPEIDRLQAIFATQFAEPGSDKREAHFSGPLPSKENRSADQYQLPSSISDPEVPLSEDNAETAARRQRLSSLQQELALLKRTPSMQLMGRQHIPRLEEAIK